MTALIQYNELEKIARETKWQLFLSGKLPRKNVRKKPRSEQKNNLLREMAIARLTKYKPYKKPDGVIVLPWFVS